MRFGGVAFQEFPARRGVEKKVADADRSPCGSAARRGFEQFSAFDGYLRPFELVRRPGGQRQAADRGDGRQRLPPEAEGHDVFDALFVEQLACAVRLQAEERVVGVHAAAVVGDGDQAGPGALDFDADPFCSRIDRVLHQFFNYRCGALDHFARGDAVAQVFGHDFDFTHDSTPGVRPGRPFPVRFSGRRAWNCVRPAHGNKRPFRCRPALRRPGSD
ncbi:hypothetical protein SDC9_182797 [bioreactor metagenome]|uniref:Uncharacterized protein n=1 Tax=bioreactor metagenome TaxID=1076179 RepID=A0A645H9C4_9ZZZZ